MRDVSDEFVSEFVNACREAGQRGLMRCSSGNMSRRVDEERMLVTATRCWMSRLTADDVVLCRIADGAVLDGPDPTVEINLHAGILLARPDIDVVMHFQSPCATTLACRDVSQVNYFVIPEIAYYLGAIGYVPYLPPGSTELADAAAEVMRQHNLAIMANHGQVTAARDFDQVIQNAEFFELACRIILQGGDGVTPLTEEAADALIAAGPGGSRSRV